MGAYEEDAIPFYVNRYRYYKLSMIHAKGCAYYKPNTTYDTLDEAIEAASWTGGDNPRCARFCDICTPGGREGCACSR